MRIAFYHCRVPQSGTKPGGVEVFVDRLSEELANRGHELTLFTYAPPEQARTYHSVQLRPARARSSRMWRQFATPVGFNFGPFNPARFDVAHMHGDDWFWVRRRLPTVRTFYGSALFEALTATSSKRRANQALLFGLELLSRCQADAVYGIGPDSRALFRADGVLTVGVTSTNAPTARSAVPTVVFIGTWEGRKRGRDLHRAFVEHVKPALPDARLVMVSDRAAAGPGVEHVHAPSDGVLTELLSEAWVFCLPSAYEGLGMPYLEAMAAGTPVLATPNPGAEHVLQGGAAGELVEIDQLGPALLALLKDGRRRDELSAAGARRAESFTWSGVLEQYEAAYALAIDRWSTSRSRRAIAT